MKIFMIKKNSCIYKTNLKFQVFQASHDASQISVIEFPTPLNDVTAIRVFPVMSSSDDVMPQLRVDVTGCYEQRVVVTTTKVVTTETTGSVAKTTSKPVVVETTTPTMGTTPSTTEVCKKIVCN